MKTFLRILGGPLFIGLLMLASFATTAGASSARSSHLLPLSPLSGGVLMAQAVHAGKVHPGRTGTRNVNPALTCSPAPCVLPNVRASEGGSPVNEDPIAANSSNSNQLFSGCDDFNFAYL